jgi:uracil permease
MLAPFAINQASSNWALALITLVIIIVASCWGKGMMKIIPILLGLAGAYVIALIGHFGFGMDILNFTATQTAYEGTAYGVVGTPPFMWPKFALMPILIMLPFAIATIAEHIADMVILKRLSGKDYIKDPGLHRTLVGDGLATMFGGAIGGPATTTYSENVGVVALTKIYDSRILIFAACYAVVLGFSPLFASIIYSIPEAIIGGASFVLYGMIAAVGIRNLIEEKVDLSDMKNTIIIAIMLVVGLGLRFGNQITFNVGETSVPIDRLGVAIAVILGIVLNLILPSAKDKEPTKKKA